MARLKRLAFSLASGYVALAANTLFTLASVPLAFSYLTKPQFGLWALASQAAGYMALIDLGMSGMSRILVDYKDQKQAGEYGGVLLTLLWVSVVQGLIILLASFAVAIGLTELLRIPGEFVRSFQGLLLGQGILLAGGFISRLLTYVLSAHQRYDLLNYAQILSFGVNYGALWIAFGAGQGVFSLLWGQACGWVLSVLLCLGWCLRLRLFPAAGHWGRPSWERFLELFRFGKDIFLFMLGSQLVNASQTILLGRVLGLEVAAAWSVCTRAFTLAMQMVYRVFDYSCAALAEMMVRQEWERLQRRFKSIVILSTSLGVVAAVILAVCNEPFVHVWSRGRIGWSGPNNLALALWLIACVMSHSHIGLVGQTKEFGLMRFLYLVEGLLFTGVTLLVLRSGGILAMLVVSVVTGLLVTFPYALWRTSRLFGISMHEVTWRWFKPSLRLLLALMPLGLLVWWLSRPLAEPVRLGVALAGLGVPSLILFLRLGIEDSLRQELLARSPAWLTPALRWVFPAAAARETAGGPRLESMNGPSQNQQ